MLTYAHLLSNRKIVLHGARDVDTPEYYLTHIFLKMRIVYDMLGYIIDVPM